MPGSPFADRYNPVLGEFFRCSYFYPDGSEGFYVAEQVSHHPVSYTSTHVAFACRSLTSFCVLRTARICLFLRQPREWRTYHGRAQAKGELNNRKFGWTQLICPRFTE